MPMVTELFSGRDELRYLVDSRVRTPTHTITDAWMAKVFPELCVTHYHVANSSSAQPPHKA